MKNVIPHNLSITQEMRSKQNGHAALVIWFTGLSGSGKSTIADAVEQALFGKGVQTYTLDGDNVRTGLNKNLGFSATDRQENIRRIAEVSRLMLDAGLVVLAAFVSPYRDDREQVKQIVGESNYVEVYVNTPLEECERRDTKGLYARARRGEIKNFTGLDAPYEAPVMADIEINTTEIEISEAVSIIMNHLKEKMAV